MKIVNQIVKQDRTFDFKKDYRDKIEKLEETLNIYLSEKDFKISKKEFPDKWNNLNKILAYPYEYFNGIDDYHKPV